MSNKNSRKYVFTSFKMEINYSEIYENYKDIVRYLVVGKEVCPKTNKEHFQGYVQFFEPCRLTKFQSIIGDKCHMETQRGLDFQASLYCKKDGNFNEFGIHADQGYRNDLESLKLMINQNKSHIECYKEHFSSYLRYRNHFDKYREAVLKENAKIFRNIKVTILSGPTRCGKTRKYLYDKDNNFKNDVFKINCNNLNWFDGYEGEKTIVFDEFKNQVKLTQFLDLLDGHLCRLSIKGAHTYALWTHAVVTTNLRKNKIYPNIEKDLIAPFWARVTDFVNFWEKCPEVTKGNTDFSRNLQIFEKKI